MSGFFTSTTFTASSSDVVQERLKETKNSTEIKKKRLMEFDFMHPPASQIFDVIGPCRLQPAGFNLTEAISLILRDCFVAGLPAMTHSISLVASQMNQSHSLFERRRRAVQPVEPTFWA
jgi:hypothetical protein